VLELQQAADGSELLTVQLTSGQDVTVAVDGFLPHEDGAFELEATFQ
jgi:hypothetical protein